MACHLKFTRTLFINRLERGDMKNTNEKDDTILVLQMVFAATENQKGFSFITDYMDVFVLLCFIVVFRNLDNLLYIDNIYFA